MASPIATRPGDGFTYINKSSATLVKFELAGLRYIFRSDRAVEITQHWLQLKGKLSLVFTNVVVASVTDVMDGETMRSRLYMWEDPGPFTPTQFLEMMSYDSERPHSDWARHLGSFTEVKKPK